MPGFAQRSNISGAGTFGSDHRRGTGRCAAPFSHLAHCRRCSLASFLVSSFIGHSPAILPALNGYNRAFAWHALLYGKTCGWRHDTHLGSTPVRTTHRGGCRRAKEPALISLYRNAASCRLRNSRTGCRREHTAPPGRGCADANTRFARVHIPRFNINTAHCGAAPVGDMLDRFPLLRIVRAPSSIARTRILHFAALALSFIFYLRRARRLTRSTHAPAPCILLC